MTEGPSTVVKALALLDFFSESRARIGLSEFSRLSGYNKATTLRFLVALESKGFVEQDEGTRTYNLGPAFLRFASLRETSFPLTDAVMTVLRDLNADTGETAHASVMMGDALANIGTVESKRANRVMIEPGEALPVHATASGHAYLAFCAPDVADRLLARDLPAHTQATQTDPRKVIDRLDTIRRAGVGFVQGEYETDVMGIAAPHFGSGRKVVGAVAVALPVTRATAQVKAGIAESVKRAARQLTVLQGGVYPADLTG